MREILKSSALIVVLCSSAAAAFAQGAASHQKNAAAPEANAHTTDAPTHQTNAPTHQANAATHLTSPSIPQTNHQAPRFADAKNSLIYIYNDEVELTNLAGVGFLVSMDCSKDRKPGRMNFLITCKHVLQGKKKVILRINTKAVPGSETFPQELKAQGKDKTLILAADPAFDLAAIYLEKLPATAEYHTLQEKEILDAALWKSKDIEEGSEIYTVGPIHGYSGNYRNVPAVRFGRIVQLSSEKWYHERNPKLSEAAYLIDINLTFGSSGSPIFRLAHENESGKNNAALELLGVVKGAPDVPSGKDTEGQPVLIPQAVTAFEPGANVLVFLKQIAKELQQRGFTLSTESRNYLK